MTSTGGHRDRNASMGLRSAGTFHPGLSKQPATFEAEVAATYAQRCMAPAALALGASWPSDPQWICESALASCERLLAIPSQRQTGLNGQ